MGAFNLKTIAKRCLIDYGIQSNCTIHFVVSYPVGGGTWRSSLFCPVIDSVPEGFCECFSNPPMSEEPYIRKVINVRDDAWFVVCSAFNLDDCTKNKIEDNSADPYIRLVDVLHYLHHQDSELTWHDIMGKVKVIDDDLAELIEQSGPVGRNWNMCSVM